MCQSCPSLLPFLLGVLKGDDQFLLFVKVEGNSLWKYSNHLSSSRLEQGSSQLRWTLATMQGAVGTEMLSSSPKLLPVSGVGNGTCNTQN